MEFDCETGFGSLFSSSIADLGPQVKLKFDNERAKFKETCFDVVNKECSSSCQKKSAASLVFRSGLDLLSTQYNSSQSEGSSTESEDERQMSESNYRDNFKVKTPEEVAESCSSSDEEAGGQKDHCHKLKKISEYYAGNNIRGHIRMRGEILFEDLPPIEDLHITIPEKECEVLGKIHSIVDQLVLVDSVPNKAALNLDSILFLENGRKVLGAVFDVLGQVSSPLYCVRFNSGQQIKERNIELGQPVYIAPHTKHTNFVMLDDIMQLKGSDASWENDMEPDGKHLDYSDDEEECHARQSIRGHHQHIDTNYISRSVLLTVPSKVHASSQYKSRYQQPAGFQLKSNTNTSSNFHPLPCANISSGTAHSLDFSFPFTGEFTNPIRYSNYYQQSLHSETNTFPCDKQSPQHLPIPQVGVITHNPFQSSPSLQ